MVLLLKKSSRGMFKKRVLMAVFCTALSCSAVEPFHGGQTVVFLGDSITHSGSWWPYIWSYYVTRFPDQKILFLNAGLAGDTATGALPRLKQDVLDAKPDTVCIMLGMNDGGRTSYVANPASENLKKQNASLTRYETSMEGLLQQLTDAGVRVIVVTPSPYDQGLVSPEARQLNTGYNDGLTRASQIASGLAEKYQCEVVDFHAPMTALLQKIQQADPARTIIGSDRIHPGSEGSWIMAWNFLKAQKVPEYVAKIVVDFKKQTAVEILNANVQIKMCDETGITMEYRPEALPLPVTGSYESANTLVPLTADLNQEIIRIQNLPDGNYQLSLDDSTAGSYTGEQWRQGVNISTLARNPNQQTAQLVFDRLMEYVRLQKVFRDIAFLNKALPKENIDVNDVPTAVDFFKTRYKPINANADVQRVESFLKWRGKEDQLNAELAGLFEGIYRQNQPVPVKVVIRRLI